MIKALVISCLALVAACAHSNDEASNRSVTDSMRELGRDVSKAMEATNTPNSGEDPESVRNRVHAAAAPLRERLEKIRQRTNNNLAAKNADKKDPTAKDVEDQAALEAELDRIEAQINAMENPPTTQPAP